MNIEDDIYQEIDGLYYFSTSKGCMPAYQLREIADKLDELNSPIEREMNDYYDANVKDW